MRKLNKGRNIIKIEKSKGSALRTLATSLFLHGKIKTTEAKAKELRVVAEKFISRAKDNKVANRRVLARDLSPKTVKKLMNEIAPVFARRQGGYTRIIKIGPRKSDGARMAIIELVK